MQRPFEWRAVVQRAITVETTPFYVCAWEPVEEAYAELGSISAPVPLRHWLSFKTQPVAPLIREWNRLERGVEVVSKFELAAALAEGFPPERILVNGVLKHVWLRDFNVPGLRVHFDSVAEAQHLAELACRQQWLVGLRLHVDAAFDPDEPEYPCQFGMTRSEAEQALAALESRHVAVRSVHFHLRSNVCDVRDYDESIQELGAACRELRVAPEFLDIGGGFPTPGSKRPGHPDPYPNLTRSFSATAELAVREFPQIQEIWMENGRFLTGRSAVLVMTVLDEKWRRETRFLVCDGGRTNHALVSDWEDHSIWPVPERTGEPCWTTVVGPTCMAFDRLARAWLPRDIRVGDALVWTEAGAYHLPWETRFSHGHAPVFWYAEGRLTCARARGSFEDWWRCWR